MIGLGSIGKRHLNNMMELFKARHQEIIVDACRSNRTPLTPELAEMITTEYYDSEELPNDYDVIFVTNPTALHFDTIQELLPKTKHMFIEKPIFSDTDRDLSTLDFHSDGIYYVACPLRHKSVIQYAKNLLNSGKQVISARAVSSSYLPDWRKGVDYRTVYSAKKALGGGVSIDLIHEWDYLSYLFGMPELLYNMQGQFSNLEIDSEDLSIYIAKYKDKLVEVHLDYFGRRTERSLVLHTNEERIDIDLLDNTVKIYSNNKEELISFPEEDIYKNEMKYFFDCLDGNIENINPPDHAFHVLDMILRA